MPSACRAKCVALVVSVSSSSAPVGKMAADRPRQFGDAAADERLAPGQPDLADATRDEAVGDRAAISSSERTWLRGMKVIASAMQ